MTAVERTQMNGVGHKKGYQNRDVFDSLLKQQGNLCSSINSNTLNHKVGIKTLVQQKQATRL